MARRKRRGTVAREHAIGRIGDVSREAAAQQHVAGGGVHEHAEGLATRARFQHDIPAQAQLVIVHRKPDEFRRGLANEAARGERLLLFRAERGGAGFQFCWRERRGKIFRREPQRVRRRQSRAAILFREQGRARGIGNKMAGHAHEFTLLRGVRGEDAFKDRDTLHALLPGHGAQAVVRRDEFARHRRRVQRLRPVAKERAMLLEKGLRRTVRIIFANRAPRRRVHGAALAVRFRKKPALGRNEGRALRDRVEFDCDLRIISAQRSRGGLFIRGHGLRRTLVETRQRREFRRAESRSQQREREERHDARENFCKHDLDWLPATTSPQTARRAITESGRWAAR